MEEETSYVSSYPKDENWLESTKDRKKKALAMWIFQLFILHLSRVDFQAFNFLQFLGTPIVTYVDEMVLATLQDRNCMIS